MKKSLFLALGALLIQSSLALAQEPASTPGNPLPMLIAAPDSGTRPLVNWTRPADCQRMWFNTEFLMWWTKKVPVNPPLLTQANNPATVGLPGGSGSSASPDTTVLLGGKTYGLGTRYGGRVTLGGWLDPDASVGVEANYIRIAPRTITRSVSSDGLPASPILTLPFRDAVTGTELAALLGGNPGGASLIARNELQGGEVNFLARLVRTENLSVNGLAGFRYLSFRESLDYAVNNGIPGAFAFTSLDSFHASNSFYGGQVGLTANWRYNNFFVDVTGKVALGTVHQVMDINGTSTDAGPFAAFNGINVPGGFFAQPTNFGHHTRNAFCVVPEADVKLGYNITRNIQGFVGYNFLLLNNVARPGTAIDHNINLSQVPGAAGFPNALVGPAAPGFTFNRSDFWAQGVTFGLTFKF